MQRELELRGGTYKSRKHIYSSKIVCGKCGNYYGSKTWHSTSKYKRVVWQCNGKYSCGCNMPTFNEEEIQEAFVNEFNKLIEVKDDFIKTNMAIVSKVFSTEKLEKDKNKLEKILHEIADKINLGIIENARKLQDQDEYNKEYAMMVAEFNKLKERLEKIESEITKKQNKKDRIESFIKALKDIDILAEFNKDLWCVAVEEAVVEKDGSIRFKWNA